MAIWWRFLLQVNQVFSDRNFGVKMLTHQITGIVYEDLNNDSYNQSVEPGIEGIEVLAYEYSITGNSGASAIHSTLTQSDGTYEFMVPDMKEYYVVLEDESIFPTINTFNAWTKCIAD